MDEDTRCEGLRPSSHNGYDNGYLETIIVLRMWNNGRFLATKGRREFGRIICAACALKTFVNICVFVFLRVPSRKLGKDNVWMFVQIMRKMGSIIRG